MNYFKIILVSSSLTFLLTLSYSQTFGKIDVIKGVFTQSASSSEIENETINKVVIIKETEALKVEIKKRDELISQTENGKIIHQEVIVEQEKELKHGKEESIRSISTLKKILKSEREEKEMIIKQKDKAQEELRRIKRFILEEKENNDKLQRFIDLDCFFRSIESVSPAIVGYKIDSEKIKQLLKKKNEAFNLTISRKSDGTYTVKLETEEFEALRDIGIDFNSQSSYLTEDSKNSLITLPMLFFNGEQIEDLKKFVSTKTSSIKYHTMPIIEVKESTVLIYDSFKGTNREIERSLIENESGRLYFPTIKFN